MVAWRKYQYSEIFMTLLEIIQRAAFILNSNILLNEAHDSCVCDCVHSFLLLFHAAFYCIYFFL